MVEAVVGDDPRFQVVSRAQGGVSAARNTGLGALPPSCRYVAFIDSDDLWVPEALAVLVAALEERPDATGVTALAELIDESGEPIEPGVHPAKLRERLVARGGRLLKVPDGTDTTFEVLVTAGRIWPPAVVLLRSSALAVAGGFDETLTISEDWDLFLRISRHGPLCFLDRQVAWYRRRAGSLTAGDQGRVVYFNDVVRFKACTSTDNTVQQRRTARRSWRTVQLQAASHTWREAVAGLRSLSRSRARRAAAEALPLLGGALRRAPSQPRPELGGQRTAMVAVVQPRPGRRTAPTSGNRAPRPGRD